MAKGVTCGGKEWAPQFILAIDHELCIGCGRCFKACGRGVLGLVEKPFEGDDEFGDDMGNKVMSIANRDDCIGCGACGRTCTKRCHSYEASV
jgi:Nif-specific ferredoxin III